MFLDGIYFLEATFTLKKVSVLLHDIFIYYTCDYVSYTYFTVFVWNVFVLRSFG